MDNSMNPSEQLDVRPRKTKLEVFVEPHVETARRQSSRTIMPAGTCEHGRLIDDILTKDGKRTGKVRCLECGAVLECGAEIDDPYQSQK